MDKSDTLLEQAQVAFELGDAELALTLFQQLDKDGSDYAALMLGWIYEVGWNIPADTENALECYKRAAERGNSMASLSLGRKLLEMDQLENAFYYLRSVAESEPAAAYLLGLSPSLPLDDRLYWLQKGVIVGNVYCLALSGRLLIRQAPFKNCAKAIWQIACSFFYTIFFGIRHKTESDLYDDKRFQK